MYGTFHALKWT